MAEYKVQGESLTAIADAIRSKTGKSDALTLDQMATEIESISAGGGSTEEWIGDGNTHIWITLGEGRTSPMLGVCPNGTVTVDWGDGTTPDTLTGTSTSTVKWTPTHDYAGPGDYMITLTVDGEMELSGNSTTNTEAYILRHVTGNDPTNMVYQNAVKRVEIGNSTTIGDRAFSYCVSLSSIRIPESVTSIGLCAFADCYSLSSIVIPEGVTSTGLYAFENCYTLSSVVIPESVTSIGNGAFENCYTLSSVVIPESVTSINTRAFYCCYVLSSIVIPKRVTSVSGKTFYNCYGVKFYDFSKHTAVPALEDKDAFYRIDSGCEIRVPAALYDEWIAATNWSTYASKIVAV